MTDSPSAPPGALGPLVLGANTFGWTSDRRTSFEVLDAFVEAGGRTIDTADVYASHVPGNAEGTSESILGEWLASRGRRDELVIGTKVFLLPSRPGLSASNIRAAIDDSLRRLRTDYVDIYYAHRDDPAVAQEETFSAFSDLVERGKIRWIGVSNFSPARIASAVSTIERSNLSPISFSQDSYNLVDRACEDDLLPVLRANGIAEVPYRALANGFLTGKYRPGSRVDSPRASTGQELARSPANQAVIESLEQIARRHGTSPAAVALAWLRERPGVAAPIASARNGAQLAVLAESFALTLPEQDTAALG